MPGVEASVAFFVAAFLLALAPGPDIIFVLTQSALFGARAGIFATLGLMSGCCVQTCAVAAGVAALVRASPVAFTFLRIFGAAYLCWLAWLSFRARPERTGSHRGADPGPWRLYLRGILMNLSNPKVLLFFLAFLPQFCAPDAGPYWLQIIYFGFLFINAALLVFCPIACLGGRLASWFNNSDRAQTIMHRVAAVIFLVFAATVAMVEQ